MTSARFAFFAAALLALAFTPACGGCDTQTPQPDAGETLDDSGVVLPPDGGTLVDAGEADMACERDNALLDAERRCATTDDCPCGAHCSLGLCAADCRGDADCDDGVCNLRGFCATSRARTPNVVVGDAARLVLDSDLLQVFDDSTARRLRLSARRAAVGAVRVVGGDGLEVACTPNAFSAECLLDGIAAQARADVWVRPTRAFAAGDVRTVDIYAGRQHETLSVTAAASLTAQSFAFSPTLPVVVNGALQGTYEGRARLLATGVGSVGNVVDVVDVVTPDEGPVVIRAQLFADGDGAIVELQDDALLLNGTPAWVGTLSVNGDDTGGALSFPSVLAHSATAFAGADVEVIVEAADADVVMRTDGGRTLSFTLVTRSLGVLAAGRAPQSRWAVSLYRTGDLPDGSTAPTVPADVVSTRTQQDITLAPGWLGSIRDAVKTANMAPVDLFGQGDVADTFDGTGTSLVGCVLEEEPEAVYQSIFLHTLGQDAALVGNNSDSYNTINIAFPPDENFSDPPFPTSDSLLAPWFLPDTLEVDVDGYYVNLPVSPAFNPWNMSFQPEPVGRSLPCAFAGGSITVEYNISSGFERPTPYSYPLDSGSVVDICDTLAAVYGCTVDDAEAGDTFDFTVDGDWDYDDGGGFGSYGFGGVTTVDVQRRCVFPEADTLQAAPYRCGELALCFDGNATAASSELSNVVDAASGDLVCTGNDQSAALALDDNPQDLSASQLRNLCLDDLERLQTLPAFVDVSTAFADSGCIDATRLLFAADVALHGARNRAVFANGITRAADDTLAIRLLQRWVQVHGFIAQESAQAERLAQVIRRVDPSDPDLPPPVDEALDASLAGWNLFLHPRFAAGIDALPGASLALADYRPEVGPGFVDAVPLGREHSEGLAVAMVDALIAQSGLVHIRLERALKTGDVDALDTARRYLKHVQLVRPMVDTMHQKARAHVGDGLLPWENRYAASRSTLSSAIERVHQLMRALSQGANAFGIDDNDLPLYFFADETGAGGRFAAISDFLLGESPASSTNFAPFAVRQAQEALADARAAWTTYKDRRTQRAYAASELDEKLEDIHLRFAGELTGYCGTPDGLATTEALENWEAGQGEPFLADRCYFALGMPGCDTNLGPWAEQVSTDDVLYQFCVAKEVQQRFGAQVANRHRAMSDILSDFDACIANADFPVACGDDTSSSHCFECNGSEFEVSPAALQTLADGVPASILSAARAVCATEFPNASPTTPGIDSVELPALENPSCYRGSLGESALTVRAIAQDIAIARAEYSEFQDRYDIAMRGCVILENGNDAVESAQAKHNDTMTALRSAKLAVDIVSTAAGGVKDCAATTAGSSPPWDKVSAGVSCGAGAVETAADIASDSLQFAMDEVQANHEELLTSLNNAVAEAQCYNDAEMELVGAKTATLRIQRAIADLQIAMYQHNELKVLAQTAYVDGLASLQAAKDRAVVPLNHDEWLDEELERFIRRFRIASRITYLTVRAVEYEYQTSLAARSAVLAAEVPDDLETALDELWTTAGTRRINGAAPTDLKVVLSLKENLLQLADNTDQAAGEAQYTDTERLRLLLTDPKHQVFDDETGDFLGYEIPFQLTPLETLGLGEVGGIGVFARNSCAERLWSVNATIQGDEDALVRGSDPSFIDVQLLKSNSFYSQWCTTGRDTDFQRASVQPSRNLFADPGLGSVVGEELGLGGAPRRWSRARMQAVFNVERDDFSDDAYANGDTSELAARGLYGEYAIFFPAGTLSTDDGQGNQTNGLDLNAVDDVLLRLDYVSVAR